MNKEQYKRRLYDVLHSQSIHKYEIIGEVAIAISLIKIHSEYNVYIYGAGKNVHGLIKYLQSEGIKIRGIVDKNVTLRGENVYGINIVSYSDFLSNHDSDIFMFIWSFLDDDPFGRSELNHMMGMKNVVGSFEIGNIKNRKMFTPYSNETIDCDRVPYYLINEDKILKTIDFYQDDESVETLIEYIRTYTEWDVYRRKQIETKYKYFCGSDGEDLYTRKDDEVWLNFGSNVGDTIFLYLSHEYPFQKIIAVEGDNHIARILRGNLELLPKEIKDRIRVENVVINNTADALTITEGERISFINADIEGAEMDMLLSFKDVIRRDRPVLAICAYHRKEDLIEIPGFINSEFENYEFKLRKYVCGFGDMNQSHELVLYAIPSERDC